MMRIIYKLIFAIIICFNLNVNAQQVGVNKKNINGSAILDLSNNTNKTLALPTVAITSITDVSLINGGAPTNGLMIYNPTKVGNLLDGIYIWDNGIWNLLSTATNNLTNLLLKGSQNGLLALNADGIYQSIIPTLGFTVIQNDITGASTNAGLITLPSGKYTLEVNLDIKAGNEDVNLSKSLGTSTSGPTQKTSHLHTYNARLVDGLGTSISTVASINALSNSSSSSASNKQHAVNFVFSFEITAVTTISVQLCHVSGGTYHFIGATNPGGITATNASIDIKEIIVHIQKRL